LKTDDSTGYKSPLYSPGGRNERLPLGTIVRKKMTAEEKKKRTKMKRGPNKKQKIRSRHVSRGGD